MTALDAGANAPAKTLSDSQVRTALWTLLVIYTLNFVDRQIVAILAEDIRADLKLSDAQLGLLGGMAFALFYTVLGIPIARFAERGNRVTIIAGALAIWSGFTALCGTAQSFVQILLYRIGVGVGEAGCTPPAHSLISDYVPPERRASALALYSMGVPIGTMVGFGVGALIASQIGWRGAFFAVGLPGIVLALAALVLLKEPRKLGIAAPTAAAGNFGDALKTLFAIPTYWWLVGAATVVSFLGYGHAYFFGGFLARAYEMPLAERGLALAVMIGISGVIGTWAGGWIADRTAARDPRAYAAVPGVAFILGTPFFLAGMFAENAYLAIALLAGPTALNSMWYGPVYAAIQGLVPAHTRATAVAVMFFVLNLIGLGLGPTTVGLLSDMFSQSIFASQPGAVGAFATACKGAIAPEVQGACAYAAGEGLRWSLVASSAVGVLALICFFMARRTITEDLARARAH